MGLLREARNREKWNPRDLRSSVNAISIHEELEGTFEREADGRAGQLFPRFVCS